MGENEMTVQERKIVTECFGKATTKVNFSKALAYAGEDNTFQDFIDTGKATGDGEFKAWLTHFFKQYNCVANAIRKNPLAPTEGTEGLLGRCIDLSAYTSILACMLFEKGLIDIPGAKEKLEEYHREEQFNDRCGTLEQIDALKEEVTAGMDPVTSEDLACLRGEIPEEEYKDDPSFEKYSIKATSGQLDMCNLSKDGPSVSEC